MLCFKALQVLTHLLPPTASGRGAGWSRCSVKSSISYLKDFAPVCCLCLNGFLLNHCWTHILVYTLVKLLILCYGLMAQCSISNLLCYNLETSISSLLEDPDSSVRAHQLYMLCLGHLSGAVPQYLIITRRDKIAVPLGEEGLTCAIDKLFKMYWVCNLYHIQLQSVFSFLEHTYEKPVSGKKRFKVVELISKLQAMS